MKHVLLVDDEPEVLEGLLLILKNIPNVTFHTAEFASQALELMENIPFNLVLADIHMPGMNGIEMWEAINRRIPNCRVIFISGVRDFDNIYRVIQNPNARFLTKMEPAERIIRLVEETLAEIDQQDLLLADRQRRELLTCLTSGGAEQQAAMDRLASMEGPLVMENGVAFVCFLLCHAWALSPQEQRDSMARLSALIPSHINKRPAHFLKLSSSYAVLIFQQPRTFAQEKFDQLLAKTERAAGISFNCIFESGLTSLQALITSCREAMDASRQLGFIHVSPQSLPQLQSGRSPEQEAIYSKIDFQIQLLKSFLLLGQKENFSHLADQLLEEHKQPIQNTDYSMYIFFQILALLMNSVAETGNTELLKRIKSERFFSGRQEDEWVQALKRLLNYCAEVFDTLFPPDPYAHPQVIASIQQYILDHLDQNLSLNVLSDQFNMTPNYLSRLFRENTDCKLHDYIAELRLSTAARLLGTTNLHVNEIASAVGYDTVHTFIRAFRRQFGDTPIHYRVKVGNHTKP